MGELKQLGRHKILRALGRGTTAVVYEAFDCELHRAVAIKAVSMSAMAAPAQRPAFSERFLREAQAIAQLHHPNIVAVYDFGQEDDLAYVVMELIHGHELRHYLGRSVPFPLSDSLHYMLQLLSALEYAHAWGIIHCDVKPANIMIADCGTLKLGDFGVARVPLHQDGAPARPVGGTPFYMSPEQVLDAAISARSDVFAAGIVLYELLTRVRPFTGEDALAIQYKIVNEPHAAPSSLNASLPRALDQIVGKALAKHPEQRYARASEFSQDIQRVLSADVMRSAADKPRTQRAAGTKRTGASAGKTRSGGMAGRNG